MGRPKGTRPNKSRDAALYEAWVSIQGKTGCAAHNGFLVFLAHKYGVSKQAIQQAIKRERARREAQP